MVTSIRIAHTAKTQSEKLNEVDFAKVSVPSSNICDKLVEFEHIFSAIFKLLNGTNLIQSFFT